MRTEERLPVSHGRPASTALLLTLLPALVLATRVDTMWVRHYEGADSTRLEFNQAGDVLVDTARDHVFVCGAGEVVYAGNSDMLVAMYDRAGVLLDTVAVGGYMSGGTDMAHAMVLNDSGNLYVAGFTYNLNRGQDVTWMKVPVVGDTFGPLTVRKTSWWLDDDVGTDIVLGRSGDIYICGARYDVARGLSALLVMRIRPDNADTVWTRSFIFDTLALARRSQPKRDLHPEFLEYDWDYFDNCATAMAVGPDSNIVVTGFGSHRERFRDWWTLKLRPSGDTVWTRVFDNPGTADTADDDVAFDVAVANSGDIYCVGFTYFDNISGTRGDYDYTIARYSGSGAYLGSLTRNFAGENGDDCAHAVCLDDATPQNVYVTGFLVNPMSEQVNTLKLSNTLATRWGTSGAVWDGSGDDRSYDVAYSRGKVYVAGRRGGVGVGTDDIMLLCYDTLSATAKDTVWGYFYGAPDGLEDFAAAVTATDSNNIYLAGQCEHPSMSYYWNSLYLARLFNPRPDVAVRRIIAPVDTVNLGDSVRPRCVVANTGNTNATFRTYLAIGASYLDSVLHVNLAPGDSALDSFRVWAAQPLGAVVLRCTVALSGDTVPANNRIVDTVMVVRRDVACSVLVSPVGVVDSGTPVVPQAWVRNLGNLAASFDCRLAAGSFYADTQRITLAPGASALVGFDSLRLTRRGTWAVTCSTMLAGDAPDSNNFRRDSVTVIVTDAAVAAMLSPADSVDSGAVVVPQVRLANYGTQAADLRAWFRMEYGTDTVAYFDSLALTLAPAAESVVTFDSAAPLARFGRWRATSWLVLARDQHAENDSIARAMYVRPPGGVSWPPGWQEVASMPPGAGKTVKGGGALCAMPGATPARIFATKGQKTQEFYSFDLRANTWTALALLPLGTEDKPADKGCRLIADNSGSVYATKGSNTLGWYRYNVARDSWTQLADVPAGLGKVKGGTDMAFVEKAGVGYVYLLKGYKNEFHRYNTADGTWQTMANAPGAVIKWDKGSFLVYDNQHTIYAHKAKYNELWRYDTDADSWGAQLTGMPFFNAQGKKKKSKDGAGGAWFAGYMYALKGGNTQEFWRYRAAGDSWAEMETIPILGSTGKKKKVSTGGDLVYNAYAFWALKGNKTREFWRYGITLDASGDMPFGDCPLGGRRLGLSPNGVDARSAGSGNSSLVIVGLPLASSPVLVYNGSEATTITARVYDAAGRLVTILLAGYRVSGPTTVRLNTGDLSGGVYLLQVAAGAEARTYKLAVR